MASVNKVIIVGNCGRDPELRYMANGTAVANVSVATSSRRKNRDTGEVVEETQWHRVTFYDRLAEIAGEYVKKGRPIYVEGRLKYGKYTGQDGVEKPTTEIVAIELQLLGSRDDQGENESAAQQRERTRAPAPAQRAAAPTRAPAPAPKPNSGFDDMDDDIPF